MIYFCMGNGVTLIPIDREEPVIGPSGLIKIPQDPGED